MGVGLLHLNLLQRAEFPPPGQFDRGVGQTVEAGAVAREALDAVIHSGGAVDYGIQRFAGHCTRFDRVAHAAVELAKGREPGPLEKVQVEEADMHDGIFPTINPAWWI